MSELIDFIPLITVIIGALLSYVLINRYEQSKDKTKNREKVIPFLINAWQTIHDILIRITFKFPEKEIDKSIISWNEQILTTHANMTIYLKKNNDRKNWIDIYTYLIDFVSDLKEIDIDKIDYSDNWKKVSQRFEAALELLREAQLNP
ncbi:MAG: hypothetical protein ACFFAU_19665 [Candidatus Hodarchaeota archaeon]